MCRRGAGIWGGRSRGKTYDAYLECVGTADDVGSGVGTPGKIQREMEAASGCAAGRNTVRIERVLFEWERRC
jgi:hypothetical protein